MWPRSLLLGSTVPLQGFSLARTSAKLPPLCAPSFLAALVRHSCSRRLGVGATVCKEEVHLSCPVPHHMTFCLTQHFPFLPPVFCPTSFANFFLPQFVGVTVSLCLRSAVTHWAAKCAKHLAGWHPRALDTILSALWGHNLVVHPGQSLALSASPGVF